MTEKKEQERVAKFFDSRADVPEQYRWRLKDMYSTVGDWEKDLKRIDSIASELKAMKGHVTESAVSLYRVFSLDTLLDRISSQVFCYARMSRDEDNNAEGPKTLAARAMQACVAAGEATAFIVPEILASDADTLNRFMEEDSRLEEYRLCLKRILRDKPHVLSAEEEAVLAAMGEAFAAPDQAFSMLTDADMDFGTITDADGKTVPLTQESYGRYVSSTDRSVRRAAFEGIHRTYARFGNTLAALYSASVKNDVTSARLRHFDSALEASLFANEIPVSVYSGLVDAVNSNLSFLHKYVGLKKRALGVEKMEPWDLYAPFSHTPERRYTYEEAKEIVLKAVAPLGEKYGDLMRESFNNRWIDVYENKGKTSGAYSWGCYGVHPYMLLNYGGTYRDVSTLAHEGGHSMHTALSNASQPYQYSSYSLFVAEVASTVNEMLLGEYMLSQAETREEKISLLAEQLELIRQTIYRQTLFAEFERDVHDRTASGGVLTPESMNSMWKELNTRYYGEEAGSNECWQVEWSRIPHFYRAFYVYQYATSLSAAVALSDLILNGGEKERDAYLDMLRGGCSTDPISLLKQAGVDMSTPAPVERALAVFAKKTGELEKLLG